jgi:hypothetical protein
MHDSTETGRRKKRWAGAAGLLAAGAVRPDEKTVASSTAATADGSLVTVKFDKNLKVTKVEAGLGTPITGP